MMSVTLSSNPRIGCSRRPPAPRMSRRSVGPFALREIVKSAGIGRRSGTCAGSSPSAESRRVSTRLTASPTSVRSVPALSPRCGRRLSVCVMPLLSGHKRCGVVAQDLGHDVELVEQHPVLYDPAAREVELRQSPQVNAPAGRLAVQSEAAMRADCGPAHRGAEAVALVAHPVDLVYVHAEVGKGREQAPGHCPDVGPAVSL